MQAGHTRWRRHFFQPSDLAPRIVAQSGWFSVHCWNADFKTPGFSNLAKIKRTKDRVKYLVIPRDAFHDLRVALDLTAVTSASLFPDLDGLCRHLKWTHARSAAPAGAD